MEKHTVRCNNCGWKGCEEDLEKVAEVVSSSSDVKDTKTEWINACPKCKTDHYLMDIPEKKYNWYKANTSNGQGLIIEEVTGRNVAVSYDEKDAPLIASAPELLEALKQLIGFHKSPALLDPLEANAVRNAEIAISKAEATQ